jgi:hypothetical protein
MNLYQKVKEKYDKPKPILFNTEMVRAILEGRKNQTRRPIDVDISNNFDCDPDGTVVSYMNPETGDIYNPLEIAPYQSGDILYVRETFAIGKVDYGEEPDGRAIPKYSQCKDENDIIPKEWAIRNDIEIEEVRWKPSIHMPKEAARLFLKVTNVRVERLQDISNQDIRAEGVCDFGCAAHRASFQTVWNDIYKKPKPVIKDGEVDHYISYPWDDITETREHKGKKWHIYGNPWVWVIEFKKFVIEGDKNE